MEPHTGKHSIDQKYENLKIFKQSVTDGKKPALKMIDESDDTCVEAWN